MTDEVDLLLQDLSQAAIDYTANRLSTSEQPLEATIQALCSLVARLDAFSIQSSVSKGDDQVRNSDESVRAAAAETLQRTIFRLFESPKHLPNESSLIGFVISTVRRSSGHKGSVSAFKDITKARADVINLTANLILIAPFAVIPHLPFIREMCLTCIQCEVAAEPARAALLPLQYIMEHRLMSSETFKPAQVLQILQMVLSRTGVFRSMQTVTGPTVATVGLLLATFPETVSEANALREYESIMAILRKEWPASTAATKAGEHMAVVSGCLQALDALLAAHNNVIQLADEAKKPQAGMAFERTELFNHLLRAISSGHHGGQIDAIAQSRFSSAQTSALPIGSIKNLSMHSIDSSATALLIISHHANLFAGPILSGAEPLFDMLIFSVHCKRARISEVAPAAFRAFLSVIANGLSTETELEWLVQSLKAMVKGRQGLLDVVASRKKVSNNDEMEIVRNLPGMVEFNSFLDVTAGMSGLSLLALPIIQLHGIEEGLSIAREVLHCTQVALTSGHLSIKVSPEDEVDENTTTLHRDIAKEQQRLSKTEASQLLFKRRRALLLSNAISCYASFIQHLPSSTVDETVLAPALNALEQLVISFPSLSASGHNTGGRDAICRAALSIFMSLAADVTNITKISVFTSIIDRLVPAIFLQTLSINDKGASERTDDSIQLGAFYDPATVNSSSSSMIGLELVHPKTGLPESKLLFEYIPFWREVIVQSDLDTTEYLKSMHIAQGTTESFSECKQRISECIYSALMRQVLLMINSCNLSLIASETIAENVGSPSSSSTTDEFSSFVPSFDGGSLLSSESSTLALSMNRSGLSISSNEGVTPANKNDYSSILSCVEFLRYSLPLLPKQLLVKWAFVLIRACVKGSSRFPHFSGFYTLSAAILLQVDDAGGFNKCSLRENDNTILFSESVTVDIVSCIRIADVFADEAIARAKHSSGELLLASLQFVLLLPSVLVRSRPDRHIVAIHLALSVGATNPVLSTLGIYSLERFCSKETLTLLKPEFSILLPRLGDILEQSLQTAENSEDIAGISIESSKQSSVESKKKSSDDDDEDNDDDTVDEEETEDADEEVLNQDVNEDSEDATRDASLAGCLRRSLNSTTRTLLTDAAAAVSLTMSASSTSKRVHLKTQRSRFLHQKLSMYASDIIISSAIEDNDLSSEMVDHDTRLSRTQDYNLLQLADQDVSLSNLRERIMLLLAKLGADASNVLGRNSDCIRNEIDWGVITGDASIAAAIAGGGAGDSPGRLSLNLRFCGESSTEGGPISVSFQLVSVLPRVVTLCLSANSRQVKSAACEFLHAILSLTIGKLMTDGGQSLGEAKMALTKSENDSPTLSLDSDSPDESRLLSLFSKLFPTCLRLAVDGEDIAKQLFEPLSLQIVRLFSSRDELPEAQRVVDSVSDSLTSSDSSLRDFAALCYAEFVKWSIKQHSERTLKLVEREEDGDMFSESIPASSSSKSSSASLVRRGGPLSLEALFRRMLAAARHPNADHRLGACLAWSHIYRTFREQKSLVSRYIFLILDHMLLALRLSATDGSRVLGTAVAAAAGADHCLRIILKFSHLLLQNDSRSPQASRTLSELVSWLFTKGCCIAETQARRKCIQLFDAIAPVLVKLTFPGLDKGLSSNDLSREWVRAFFSKENATYDESGQSLLVFDKVSDLAASLLPQGETFPMPGSATAADLKKWCDNLSACLDVYVFMIKRGFVKVSDVLSRKVFLCVIHFIEQLAVPPFTVLGSGTDIVMNWLTSDGISEASLSISGLLRSRAVLLCRVFVFFSTILETEKVNKIIIDQLVLVAIASISSPGRIGIEDVDLACISGMAGAGLFVPITAASFIKSLSSRHAISSAILAGFSELGRSENCGPKFLSLGAALLDGDSSRALKVTTQPRSISIRQWCSAIRAVSDAGLLNEVIVNSKQSDITVPGGIQELAASLGNAAFSLNWDAPPDMVEVAEDLLSLALDLGWPLQWTFENALGGAPHVKDQHTMMNYFPSLSFALGLQTDQINALTDNVNVEIDSMKRISCAQLTLSRFGHSLLLPYLLRADVYAASLMQSAVPGEDRRLDPNSYPLIQLVFSKLLSFVSVSKTQPQKAAMRDHLWKTFHLLISATLKNHETSSKEIQEKKMSASMKFQIRASTFVNSVHAFIPSLSCWVTESAETQIALVSIFLAMTKIDPWLIALSPQHESNATASRGAQVRTLSHEAASVLVSLLKTATSSSFAASSSSLTQEGYKQDNEQGNVQRDLVLQLLPFLLPGFSSTAPLPASTVNQLDTFGVSIDAHSHSQRRLGQSGFLALLFVQKLVIYDFPMRSAELVNDPLREKELSRFKFTMSTLLTTLTATGSLFLLRAVSLCFREGRKHIMMANIAGSLHALALSVSPDGESPRALIREVLLTIFATKSSSSTTFTSLPRALLDEENVSSILCEHLAVPLLQRLSENTLVDVLTSKLFFSSLHKVIDDQDAILSSTFEDRCEPSALRGGGSLRGKPPTTLLHYLLDGILASSQKQQLVASSNSGAGVSKLHCMRTHCRLNILAAAFDSLRDISIKNKLYPVYKSELPVDDNIKDNQLSLDVLRSCEALIRSGPVMSDEKDSDSSRFIASQAQLLRLRQAAYQLLLSCCLRTQTRMSVLYAYLFREDEAKPEKWFWHRLVDTNESCVDVSGLKPGGLPYLSGSFAVKRTLASLSSFFPVTPLPDTLACTDAYAAGARAVAAGASICTGYGSFAGFAVSNGPLSQALSAARAPDFSDNNEEKESVNVRSRSRFHVDAHMSQSLLAEGTDTVSFAASKSDTVLAQKDVKQAKEGGSLTQSAESSLLGANFVAPSVRAQLLSAPIPTGGPSAQTLDIDFFNASPMMLPLLRIIDFIDASSEPVLSMSFVKTDSPSAPQDHMDTLTTAALPSSRDAVRRVTFSSTQVTTVVNFDQAKLNGDPHSMPPLPPAWMAVLLKRSSSPNPLPLRLFMARIVLNRPTIFKPFAQLWAPQLMKLILDLSVHAKTVITKGESPIMSSPTSFHYIMRDVCRLLCVDWAWNGVSDEKLNNDDKMRDENLDDDDIYGDQPEIQEKKPAENYESKATRAKNCFVPRSPEEKVLCEAFLTHVIESSPTSNKSMLEFHMRFFGVLIVKWAPFGIRFRRKRIAPLLQAKSFGRVHSSSLSIEGAKVAVASSAFWYASERAGQAMLDPTFDTTTSTSLNIDQFHSAIVNRVQNPDSSRGQADCLRFAMLLGTELKRAAQRVKAGRAFQPDGLRGDAVLLENADAMLERSFAASQTRSGVSTTERGIGQFLFSLSIIAQSYPSIVSRNLLAKALQPLSRFTGRSHTRGKILATILRIGRASVSSGRIKDKEKREDIYVAFERYLPLLLHARVSSRARGASVQFYCLQLIGSLIPYLQLSDVVTLFDDKSPCNLPLIFSNHPSRKCRSLFFDVCEKLWSAKLKIVHQDTEEPAEKKLSLSADDIFASNGAFINDINMDDGTQSKLADDADATANDEGGEEEGEEVVNTGTEFAKRGRVRINHVAALSDKDQLKWVHSRLRTCLLRGLCDRDRELRSKSYAFWNSPDRLSAFLPKRILQLSTIMFDSKEGSTEAWAHHAAPLILSLAGRGDSSDEFISRTTIFPFALGGEGLEKPLYEANINVPKFGVSSGAGTLKPLFSQVVSDIARKGRRGAVFSSSVSGAMSSATSSFHVGLAVGMVRATQRDEGGNYFSLTQHPTSSDDSTTLNPRGTKSRQGIANSFAPEGVELAGLSQQHVLFRSDGRALMLNDVNSLTAGDLRSGKRSQSIHEVWATLQQSQLQDKLTRKPSLTDKDMSIDDDDADIRSPSVSRFRSLVSRDIVLTRPNYIDPVSSLSAEVHGGAADFGDLRLTRAIEMSLNSKKRQPKSVIMTRAYRIGELPDIQVSQKDLIFPLQTLCEIDSKIAHTTFSTLFLATYAALPHILSDPTKSSSTFTKADGNITQDLSVPQPVNKSQALVPSVDAFVVHEKRKRSEIGVGSSQQSTIITRSVLLAGIKQMLQMLCSKDGGENAPFNSNDAVPRNPVATPFAALLLEVLAGSQRLDHIGWANNGVNAAQQIVSRETAKLMRAFIVNPQIIGVFGSSHSAQASSIRVLEESLQSRGIAASYKDSAPLLVRKNGLQQKEMSSRRPISLPYSFGVNPIPNTAGTARGLPNVNPPANPHLSLTSNTITLPSMTANSIESAEAWAQLKRLYLEIGDVDAVSSLASLTTASVYTRSAYSFEMVGDFKQAQTSFEDAITEWESVDASIMSIDRESSSASASMKNTQFSQYPTQMSEAPLHSVEHASSASFATVNGLKWNRLRTIMSQLRWRSSEESLNAVIKFGNNGKSLSSQILASLPSEHRLIATRILLHRASGEGNPLLALDFDDGDKVADELLESRSSTSSTLSTTISATAAKTTNTTASTQSSEFSHAQMLRESNSATITGALRLNPEFESGVENSPSSLVSGKTHATKSAPPFRLFEALSLIMSGQMMSAYDVAKTGLEEAAGAYSALSPLSRPERLRSLSKLTPLAEIREHLTLTRLLRDAFASGSGSLLNKEAINEAYIRFPRLFWDMCDRKTVFSGSRFSDSSDLSASEKSFIWDDFILTRTFLALKSAQIVNNASRRFPTSEKLDILRRVISSASSAALRHTIASACLDAMKSGARTQSRALLRHLERVEDDSLSKESRGLHSLTYSRLGLGLRTANFEARMAESAAVVVDSDVSGINETLLKPGDVLLDALSFAEEGLLRLTLNDRRETSIRAFLNNITDATDGLVAVTASLGLHEEWKDSGKQAAERALLSHHLFGRQVLLAEAHVAYASYAVSRESSNIEISCRSSDIDHSLKEGLKLLSACVEGKLLYMPQKYDPKEKLRLTNVAECIGFILPKEDSKAYVSLPKSKLRTHAFRVSHCQLLLALLSDSVLRHMEDEDEVSKSSDLVDEHNSSVNIHKSLSSFGEGSRGKLANSIVESSLKSLSGETDTTLHWNYSSVRGYRKRVAAVIPSRGIAYSSILDDSFAEGNFGSAISPTLLVPRLIELVLAHEEAKSSFVKILKLGTGSFRSFYVFLPWISQILAALHHSDRPGAPELAALLLELATVYPQAVYYPLRMSTGLTLNSKEESAGDMIEIIDPQSRPKHVHELVAPIRAELALKLPLHDAFSRALEDLHNPELKVTDWINVVQQAISIHRNQSFKSLSTVEFERVKNTDAVRELPQAQQKAMFNCLVAQFNSGRSIHGSRSEGTAIKKFWKAVHPLLNDLYKNGLNVTSKSLELLSNKIRKGDFSEERSRAPKLVSHLSAWLASFNASDYSLSVGTIEVPGQYDRYDGRAAPISSTSIDDGMNNNHSPTHVRITSVDPRMITLGSARRPKRISFIANDERVYSFLAKGGEDIRVDQRVQQLFRTSNTAFNSFSTSSSRNLRLRTYSVVPVTPFIGLIEWISRSIPLKVLMEKEATSRLSSHSKSLGVKWQPIHSHANLERKRWMDSFASSGEEGQTITKQNEEYRNCYRQGTGKNAEDAWTSVMSYQPVDLLRSALIKMAPSPEGFLAVRSSFLRSFACINVSGFILGIGDRHLDNFLFTSDDATLIAIDFGVLFGAGSSTLSVPELIPFRLSSNLACVASPLPTMHLLHTLMASALSALQTETSKRSVLTSMESFVNEPTLDWKLAALRKVSLSKNPSDGSAVAIDLEGSWYPRAKLLIASLKLRRANPGPLLLLELLQNQHVIPTRSRINDPKISTLVSGIRSVALGIHRETEHPRRHLENISSQFRLTRIERVLLETALGGPLSTNNALDVRLTVCKDALSQAMCLIDLASDPNVLVRQYAGLCLWV